MVTSQDQREARLAGKDAGCDDFLAKPVDAVELSIRVHNLIALRRYHQRIERHSYRLEREVEARTAELRRTLERLERAEWDLRASREETIVRLGRALALREGDEGGHAERVGRTCELLARRLGLPDARCELLRLAASLHDIGTLGLPGAVVRREPGAAAAAGVSLEQHVEIGHRLLGGSLSDVLRLADTLVLVHHERLDGSGYPEGLAGDQIPREGRICAVADVLDTLVTAPPAGQGLAPEAALEYLVQGRGRLFDAEVVDVLSASLDRVLAIREAVAAA